MPIKIHPPLLPTCFKNAMTYRNSSVPCPAPLLRLPPSALSAEAFQAASSHIGASLHACDHARCLVLFPISPSPLPLPAVQGFPNNYHDILPSPSPLPTRFLGDSPFSIPSISFRSMFPAVRLSSFFYSVRPASLLTRGLLHSSLCSIAPPPTRISMYSPIS